ncbi:hypothetical protein ACIBCU_33065 [Streptomyces sp. NPDC051064]|uniref:hypothetical protein n=1 Tax=Streptomyces sp. NPDC051064 TaxID=3365641 RepID=UPI003787E5D7
MAPAPVGMMMAADRRARNPPAPGRVLDQGDGDGRTGHGGATASRSIEDLTDVDAAGDLFRVI